MTVDNPGVYEERAGFLFGPFSPIYGFVTCIICAAVSVMTGSSWTTIATIGVALLCIGSAIGIPVYWVAGSIISGAYFGDKVSSS